MSDCSHEEAVNKFLEAKEPILVEVKRKPAASLVKEHRQEENYNQPVSNKTIRDYPTTASISRESQTDFKTIITANENECMRCDSYDCSNSDENIIFPDLEYEVKHN